MDSTLRQALCGRRPRVVAEPGIVLERAQILAGGCQHRLWFDAEPRKAVLGHTLSTVSER